MCEGDVPWRGYLGQVRQERNYCRQSDSGGLVRCKVVLGFALTFPSPTSCVGLEEGPPGSEELVVKSWTNSNLGGVRSDCLNSVEDRGVLDP